MGVVRRAPGATLPVELGKLTGVSTEGVRGLESAGGCWTGGPVVVVVVVVE